MPAINTTMQRFVSSIWTTRLLLLSTFVVAIISPPVLNRYLASLYEHLYHSPIYRFSGFETIETILCYAIIEPLYTYKFGHSPHLRLDARPSAPPPAIPKMKRPSTRLREFLIYATPLLALDLLMIKKFAGVPAADLLRAGGYDTSAFANSTSMHTYLLQPTLHNFSLSSPLQFTRPLPPSPPTTRRIALELPLSVLIYDFAFFLAHLALHWIPFLAPAHMPHHAHAEMHPQVANQLGVPERLVLVLLANFALNVIGSYVLTRTLFVPVFVYLLVEIHSGLDLPWVSRSLCRGGGRWRRGGMLCIIGLERVGLSLSFAGGIGDWIGWREGGGGWEWRSWGNSSRVEKEIFIEKGWF
ncbi:MAG: hypothetical protein MMC23_008450 [Stictis urceolatum]|nr:hypothetical protein [Stictis urceolata]